MIRRHCQCGSGLIAYPLPGGEVAKVVTAFDRQHRGDGHGPVDTQPDQQEDRP